MASGKIAGTEIEKSGYIMLQRCGNVRILAVGYWVTISTLSAYRVPEGDRPLETIRTIAQLTTDGYSGYKSCLATLSTDGSLRFDYGGSQVTSGYAAFEFVWFV